MARREKPTNLAQAFETCKNDYAMSKTSRFVRRRTGLAPQGGSADYHYRSENKYYEDIEKARDLDRNDAVVGQTVDRAVTNIIQDGFTLDCKTGDTGLDAELVERWNEFANDADTFDIAGELTFHDLELQATRSTMLDGDCVITATEDGPVQYFESHEIQTTTRQVDTFLGVTKGTHGRRLQYWVRNDPTTPNAAKEQSVPFDVRTSDGLRQLFHVYNPRRTTMTRGVTAFAPIFEITAMCEDIHFAKLVQQQVVSCFTIFRKRTAAGGPRLPSIAQGPKSNYGELTTELSSTGETKLLEGLGPGTEVTGAEGEEIEGFSPNVPNAEFFDQMKLLMQLIGANLGLPLCMVLMDGSETNFSGWRGAVDEARKGFQGIQRGIRQKLHIPLFKFKVAQWMAEDAAMREVSKVSGIDLFAHEWTAPRWSYINPLEGAKGDELILKNTLQSLRRVHADKGQDWQTIATEMIDDTSFAILAAKKKAREINAQFPDDVPIQWRDLINLPMTNGVQQTLRDPLELQNQEKEPVLSGN